MNECSKATIPKTLFKKATTTAAAVTLTTTTSNLIKHPCLHDEVFVFLFLLLNDSTYSFLFYVKIPLVESCLTPYQQTVIWYSSRPIITIPILTIRILCSANGSLRHRHLYMQNSTHLIQKMTSTLCMLDQKLAWAHVQES